MRRQSREVEKMFLYGYFGFSNVGDDLLLKTVIDHVRSRTQRCRFVVRSYSPVAAYASDPGVRFSCSERILDDQAMPKWRRFIKYLGFQWRELAGCSRFVFCGGTLFHDRNGSPNNLILILSLVLMARLRGAKVYALGVGVASLSSRLARMLLKGVVLLSTDFVVRDVTSFNNAVAGWGGAKIRQCADMVFGLPLARATPPEDDASMKVLGLTIAASDIGDMVAQYPSLGSALKDGVARLRQLGWTVSLLCFQEFPSPSHELSDARLFSKLLDGVSGLEVVPVSSNIDALAEQIRRMDVVAGMRFHGVVAAVMLGVPVVAFGRDRKLADLCHLLDMPFFDLHRFDADDFCHAVQQVSGRYPNEATVARCRTLSTENFAQFDKGWS